MAKNGLFKVAPKSTQHEHEVPGADEASAERRGEGEGLQGPKPPASRRPSLLSSKLVRPLTDEHVTNSGILSVSHFTRPWKDMRRSGHFWKTKFEY